MRKELKDTVKIVVVGIIIIISCFIYYLVNYKNNDTMTEEKNVVEQMKTSPTPRPTPIVMVKEKYKKGKLLQKHTVYHYSDYNRDINLDNAAKKINGTKLMPFEEFEFYEAIGGEPTEETGFVKAGTIINGNSVDTFGGGICEVATSLNTVIIDAGIATNAEPHSKDVKYLNKTDHEATVAFGLHTLRFTNTLKYPILIKQKAIAGNVRTKLYKMKTIYVVTLKDVVTGEKTVKRYSKKNMPEEYKQFIPEY